MNVSIFWYVFVEMRSFRRAIATSHLFNVITHGEWANRHAYTYWIILQTNYTKLIKRFNGFWSESMVHSLLLYKVERLLNISGLKTKLGLARDYIRCVREVHFKGDNSSNISIIVNSFHSIFLLNLWKFYIFLFWSERVFFLSESRVLHAFSCVFQRLNFQHLVMIHIFT